MMRNLKYCVTLMYNKLSGGKYKFFEDRLASRIIPSHKLNYLNACFDEYNVAFIKFNNSDKIYVGVYDWKHKRALPYFCTLREYYVHDRFSDYYFNTLIKKRNKVKNNSNNNTITNTESCDLFIPFTNEIIRVYANERYRFIVSDGPICYLGVNHKELKKPNWYNELIRKNYIRKGMKHNECNN